MAFGAYDRFAKPLSLMRGAALLLLLAVLTSGSSVCAQFLAKEQAHLPISQNALVASYQFGMETGSGSSTEPAGYRETVSDVLRISPKEAPLPGQKNGAIAATLSFIIPGLGEYYVGDQWWRGAIFTGIEAGLWLERINFIHRGDDSTIAFRTWADTLWSPDRYAAYLNSLLAGRGIKPMAKGSDFTTINSAEDTLNILGFPDFTHKLPIGDRQQYYELISKYIQFTPGWRDDITHNPADSKYYQRHAEMRETMNHQYEIADYFIYGVILNHILSAIDASLVAKDHNAALRLQGGLKTGYYQDGTKGYVPTAEIAIRF